MALILLLMSLAGLASSTQQSTLVEGPSESSCKWGEEDCLTVEPASVLLLQSEMLLGEQLARDTENAQVMRPTSTHIEGGTTGKHRMEPEEIAAIKSLPELPTWEDRMEPEEEEPELIAAIKSLPELPTFAHQPEDVLTYETSDNDKAFVNIHLNTDYHFEVAIAMAHWFAGGTLPYHSAVPQHVERILSLASKGQTRVYLNDKFTKKADRQRILKTNMKRDSIEMGAHPSPDLTVIVTVYSHLAFYEKAAQSNWFNNSKLLLLVHDFRHAFSNQTLHQFGRSFPYDPQEFMNFRNWKNVMGVRPGAPQWVLPTFFPFPTKPNTLRLPTTLCVQGGVYRRDWGSLQKALEKLPETCNDTYKIRVAGHGQLNSYMKNHPHVQLFNNLNDVQFGEFFHQCDHLLFLADRHHSFSSVYFNPEALKLTSSVTRALGAKLPVIAERSFKKMYPMLQGEFYDDDAQFSKAIEKVARCETRKWKKRKQGREA